MTDKREDREALIEAFKSKASEWDSYDFVPGWDYSPEAAILADIALAVFEQAHTPTNDEREALVEEATWALIEWDTDTVDRGVRDEHYRERRADIERVFPILFRRPVQGELPTCQGCSEDDGHGEACRACGRPYSVQGEPSDAYVTVLASEFEREWDNRVAEFDPEVHDESGFIWEIMRAALRAAAAVTEQGENR